MKRFNYLSKSIVAGGMTLACFCGIAAAYNQPLQNFDLDVSNFDVKPDDNTLENSKRFVTNDDGSKTLIISGTTNQDKSPDPRHIPYDLDENGNRVLIIGRDASEPYAVAPPTKKCYDNIFNENWSNTHNYTYTKYYFNGGTFTATADTDFVADFYKLDGTFLDSNWAWIQDGKYTVNAKIDLPIDYYVILTNKSSTPSKNAVYYGQQAE